MSRKKDPGSFSDRVAYASALFKKGRSRNDVHEALKKKFGTSLTFKTMAEVASGSLTPETIKDLLQEPPKTIKDLLQEPPKHLPAVAAPPENTNEKLHRLMGEFAGAMKQSDYGAVSFTYDPKTREVVVKYEVRTTGEMHY